MVSIYHSSAGLNGSTKQQYIYFDSTDFQSYYYTNKYDLRHLFRVFEHVKGTTIIVTIVSMFFFMIRLAMRKWSCCREKRRTSS